MSDSKEEELRKRVEELEKRLEEVERKKQNPKPFGDKDYKNISRRKFLKGLAGGAAGIGALSALPLATAFQINSQNGFAINGQDKFNIDANGNMRASSIDLGNGPIESLAGPNLSVNSNNSLAAPKIDTLRTKVSTNENEINNLKSRVSTLEDTSTDTSTSDYEVIKVPAGETFTEDSPEFNLSDGGTWENKLIDVTAEGAGAFIDVKILGLTNWTIRNIGIKGINEGAGHATFWLGDIQGGTSRIENIYLGDGDGYSGSGDGRGPGEGETGIFIHPDHSGTLTIDRLNVQKFDDNGVYGSGPGKDKPEASHGNVIIKNSFAKGNDASCFRIAEGKDQSKFQNCVAVSSDSARGFWAENGEVYVENCDSSGNNQQYCVGSSDSTATMHITNSRADESDPIATWDVCTSGTFNGEFGNNPRTQPPEGVPTTPEEAASGL